MVEYRDVRNNVRDGRFLGESYVLTTWTDGGQSRLSGLTIGADDLMHEKYNLSFGSLNEAMEYGKKIAEQLIEKRLKREQGED
jgi:hypothetical protein